MKILDYISLFILMFSFSCNNVLEENPKFLVAEQFYNSPEELETAVNAIFNPLKGNCFGNLYTWQLEIYSDFQLGRGSYAVLNDYQGLDNTNVSRMSQIWEQFYLAIRNANLVIENAPLANNATESEIAKYIGEAKFLRALCYFYMIPNWGKLPIVTELNYHEGNIPLSNEEEVYKLIIEDLDFAEVSLPDNPAQPGRPTKWAAKTMLAHVYFTKHDYDQAKVKSKEVINSGLFELISIKSVDDFEKLYGADLVNTSEEIFYIKFNRESQWSYVGFMHHPEDPYFNGGGLFAMYMDTVLLAKRWNEWDKRDLRKQLYYPWEFGLGSNTMLNNKYIDKESLNGGAANDFTLYRYADVLLYYVESAVRSDNSISEEALEILNMVHRRGYGLDINTPSEFDFELSDFSDLEGFLETVIMERAYETYYEGGKRWLDLKRLGNDVIKKVIKDVQGKDIAERHFLWPIPSVEIELNDAIDPSEQNPGY